MAEMTPQDTESCIDIVVFANTAQTEEATTAVVDNFVPVSLISTGLVHCLQVRYEEHHRGPVQDSQKRRHVLLDYVELHLHRSDVSKSRSETFYVVESIEAVVLRTAAVPRKEESNVLMFGLEPQIEAMTALNQKRQQEHNRQLAQSRRAEERKSQEKREKQRRNEDAQVH